MSLVKVSVVVPVYNVEPYLEECIQSLCNQSLKEIEIICVNDGSTDGSGLMLEAYARNDKRIRVIHKKNSGYGHTMNVGIDAAVGEYIGIVESDDYVSPDMYKVLYEAAVENEADFVKSDFYRFTGDIDKKEFVYFALAGKRDKDRYYNVLLNPHIDTEVFRFIMNTWSGIYRHDFINKHGIRHNETPGASFQDNGFWFQTFCLAKRIIFLDKPLYMNRRDNPNSSVKSKEKVYCANEEFRYIRSLIEKNPGMKEFIGVYMLKKYHNYIFTYNRIDDKFKKEYARNISKEFRRDKENGDMDLSYFDSIEKRVIKRIMRNPGLFYLRGKTKRLLLSILEMFPLLKTLLHCNTL